MLHQVTLAQFKQVLKERMCPLEGVGLGGDGEREKEKGQGCKNRKEVTGQCRARPI